MIRHTSAAPKTVWFFRLSRGNASLPIRSLFRFVIRIFFEELFRYAHVGSSGLSVAVGNHDAVNLLGLRADEYFQLLGG